MGVCGRGLVPRLGRDACVVLASELLSAVGTGMTLPFLLVYLHTVHGLSLPVAGAVAAAVAGASFVGNPLGGAASDRIGSRATLAGGLAVAGAGAVVLAGVHSTWQAFAGAAASGLGVSVAWPAKDMLLGRLESQARSAVFAVRYATMNLGLAVGALIAATIVARNDPSSYVLLYLADAASFLLAIPFLGFVRAGAGEPQQHPPPGAGGTRLAGGYRTVLRDRAFRRLWLLTAVLTTAGFGAFTAAFPVYATQVAGIGPAMLSVAYAANMVTVVLVQLVVLRLLASRRRTSALAAVGATWGATWGVVLLAGHTGPVLAAPLLIIAAVAFAVGETLLSPTGPAIVNDIAPEHLRGRYNAGSTLAYTTGFMFGPVITGLALGHGYATALLTGLMVACCLAATQAVRLARWLPAHANLTEAAGNGAPPTGTTPPADAAPPAGAAPDRLPDDLAALLADCLDRRARGDLAGAVRSAEIAWAHAARGDPSALDCANTLLVRGLLARDTGDHATARRLLDDAVATAARTAGRNATRVQVGAMTALGAMHRARGDYLAAETQLDAALRHAEAALGPDTIEAAGIRNELGMVLRYAGQFDDAAACYDQARRTLERELGASHPELATIHHNLAGLAQARGDLATAEPAARHAVTLREHALGPDHPAVAADRGVLAAVLLARGQPGEAAVLLGAILTLFERTYGPEHHEVAVVLHNLGTADHAAGRPGKAAEHLTRSLAIKERVLGPDHPELAATLCNLALIQHEAGHISTAVDHYTRASHILRATVTADHPTLRICQDALATLTRDHE